MPTVRVQKTLPRRPAVSCSAIEYGVFSSETNRGMIIDLYLFGIAPVRD